MLLVLAQLAILVHAETVPEDELTASEVSEPVMGAVESATNQAFISQTSKSDVATIDQAGQGNYAAIYQTGVKGSVAVIQQTGENGYAVIRQQ